MLACWYASFRLFTFPFFFYCYSARAWDINESKCPINKDPALFASPFRFFLAAPVYQYNKTQLAFLPIPLYDRL